MTSNFNCDYCMKKFTIEHAPDIDVMTMILLVIDAHRKQSPHCNSDTGKIRVLSIESVDSYGVRGGIPDDK